MEGLGTHANFCSNCLYLWIKKTILVCLFVYSYGINLIAQTSKDNVKSSSFLNQKYDAQPLTIGSKIPDISFHNVLNYKGKTAKLSDFSGKLVIIDMWSVFCTTCIAGFPKMEELQKEFGDKIQILLANPHDAKYDSEEKITLALNRLKARTGFYPSLPIPIHDSILNVYFPHQSVPHCVWIDGNKNVKAITGLEAVKSSNIQKLLSGNQANFGVKNDWAFDREKPLLTDDSAGIFNKFIFGSIFTGYKEELFVTSGFRKNGNNDVTGFFALNVSLRYLINIAYSNIVDEFPESKIIFDVKLPNQYKAEFDPLYAFCYNLTIPPTSIKIFDASKFLIEDLKRFFNISVFKEKRILNSLVLTASEKIVASISKHKKPEQDLENSSIKKYIHNYSIKQIIKLLGLHLEKPLIDETGISEQHLDIDFPDNSDLSKMETIIRILKKIGFELKEAEREIEVVVVTDR